MRRDLPPRPHLDHLKKQAKDLLDAQQCGDSAALDRIRDTLPAFRSRSRDEIAKAEFALHDAQSAIAREYGFASWRELRAEVAKHALASFSEDNLRAVLQQVAPFGAQPSPEQFDVIREAQTAERRAQAAALRTADLPARLPLLPVRNVLLLPGSIAPFQLLRPASLAATELASSRTSHTVAVFAQREESDEDITLERLHPIGSQALVHAFRPNVSGNSAEIVLEALRPIALDAVEQPAQAGGARFARVHTFELNLTEGADEIHTVELALRELAGQLVAALPEPDRARALLDEFDETALADLIVANIPLSVAEKAGFAAEPRLVERLRIALRWTQRLAAAP